MISEKKLYPIRMKMILLEHIQEHCIPFLSHWDDYHREVQGPFEHLNDKIPYPFIYFNS